MRTAVTFSLLVMLAVSGIVAGVNAQDCASIPYSNDEIGIQGMLGVPGDTVWARVWVITDSTLLACQIAIQLDTTILKPIRVSEGSPEIVVEPAGRFAGSRYLTARVSEAPEDSGAIQVLFLPEGPDEDTIAAGRGVILLIPLVVQEAAWYLDYGTFIKFPRRSFYVIDSTSNPPDTTGICRGTSFVERSAGPTGMNESMPRPATALFETDPGSGTEPLITSLELEPRSVRQGETFRIMWSTRNTDSVVITPDVGMHPSTSHTLQVVAGADSPTDYVLTAYGGGTSVSQSVRLLAVPPGENRYPYWYFGPVHYVSVWEGSRLQGHLPIRDPDGTTPSVSVTPLPESATVTVPSPDFVYFDWRPPMGDTGYHDLVLVLIDADDPALTDTLLFRVNVLDANQPPEWTMDTATVTIFEGDTLVVPITTADADGTVASVAAHLYGRDTLATNMHSVDHGDGTGELIFVPDYTQGNTHPTLYGVGFTIRDGADPWVFRETNRKTIRVMNRNSGTEAPVISLSSGPGPFTLWELDSVVFIVQASTTVGDRPELTADPLPPGATFAPSPGTTLSDRMVFRFRPPEGAAGIYAVTFTAVNGELREAVTVDFSVSELNRAPFILVLPGDNTIVEEDTVVVRVYGADPDSTVPVLTAMLDGMDTLAVNMQFVDSGNGMGVLTFVPNRLQAALCDPGFYYVRFRAVDVNPPYPMTMSSVRTIVVYDSGLPCCVGPRGDVNYDGNGYGAPNVSDLCWMVQFFSGRVPEVPCLAEADLDGSGSFTIADIVIMAGYLFKGMRPLLKCPAQAAGLPAGVVLE